MGGFKYNPNYSDQNTALFTKQVNGLPYLNVNVYLTVNSKGEVISKGSGLYNLGGDDAPALEDLKFADPKEAISATDFMKQWYGPDMGGFAYNPNYSRDNQAHFTKLVNGLPYLSINVRLTVNSKGEIISKGSGLHKYNLGDDAPALENMKFADPKEAISKDQAEKAFAKHLKLFYLKQPVERWDEKTKFLQTPEALLFEKASREMGRENEEILVWPSYLTLQIGILGIYRCQNRRGSSCL